MRFVLPLDSVTGTADDPIVYDTRSGSLYFDADGLGGSRAVKIAVLGAGSHPELFASEILVTG